MSNWFYLIFKWIICELNWKNKFSPTSVSIGILRCTYTRLGATQASKWIFDTKCTYPREITGLLCFYFSQSFPRNPKNIYPWKLNISLSSAETQQEWTAHVHLHFVRRYSNSAEYKNPHQTPKSPPTFVPAQIFTLKLPLNPTLRIPRDHHFSTSTNSAYTTNFIPQTFNHPYNIHST